MVQQSFTFDILTPAAPSLSFFCLDATGSPLWMPHWPGRHRCDGSSYSSWLWQFRKPKILWKDAWHHQCFALSSHPTILEYWFIQLSIPILTAIVLQGPVTVHEILHWQKQILGAFCMTRMCSAIEVWLSALAGGVDLQPLQHSRLLSHVLFCSFPIADLMSRIPNSNLKLFSRSH